VKVTTQTLEQSLPRRTHVVSEPGILARFARAHRSVASAVGLALLCTAGTALAERPGPPGTPNGTVSGNLVSLRWAEAPDDEGASGYNVYRNGRYIATVHETSYIAELGGKSNRSVAFYITAFDSPTDGSPRGFSDRSGVAYFGMAGTSAHDADNAPVDTIAPERVPGLRTTASAPGKVSLRWDPADDDTGVIGYNVYRNGEYIETVVGVTAYDDMNVPDADVVDYQVVAFDATPNFSSYSEALIVMVGDGSVGPEGPDNTPDPDADGDDGEDGEDGSDDEDTDADGGDDDTDSDDDGDTSDDDSGTDDDDSGDDDDTGSDDGDSDDDDDSSDDDNTGSDDNGSDDDDTGSDDHDSGDDDTGSDDDSSGDDDGDSGDDSGSDNDGDAGDDPADDVFGAPRNLNARLISNEWVELQWNPVADAVAYNVFRDGDLLYTVDSSKEGSQDQRYWNTTSYVDCDFTRFLVCVEQRPEAGKAYSYSVTAIGERGQESSMSDVLDVQLERNERLDVESTLVNDDFELVFEEEFTGENLALERWNTRLPWGPDVTINREFQYFVDTGREPDFGYDPFTLTGDTLRITGVETPPELLDDANDQPFLSGAITTRDSLNFTYGYVEARMKVAKGRGKLSSFFLFHQFAALNAAEIDITEYLGERPDSVSQNYHWRDERDNRTQHPSPTMFEDRPGEPFHEEFHTYGVLWEPDLVVWTIDGEEILRLTGPEVSRQRSYIILYLVMGSGWTQPPDPGDDDFDVPLEIDWVRVWQRPPFIVED